MSKKNGHSRSETWIKTKLELARLLGISRTTLDNHTLLPGFPARAANGHFPLGECQRFVTGQLNRGAERRGLEIEKLKNEVAQSQVDLMKSAEQVMPVEFVSRVLAHFAISTRNAIQGSDLTDAQKESLTAKIEAIDTDAFVASMFAEARGNA